MALLLLRPRCWTVSSSPHLVYAVLGIKLITSGMGGKHSKNSAMAHTHAFLQDNILKTPHWTPTRISAVF